jgi:hypothetical protein
MMKLILSFSALGLVLTAAIPLQRTAPTIPMAPAATHTATPLMWTSQKNLYKGDILELHFAQPHPEYLGVIHPDGRFFYVIYPKETSVGNLYPLMDSQVFSQLSSISIETAHLSADPYTYGVFENQPVFTKSGVYRFILGSNLHVDDERSIDIVKIQYQHQAAPKKPFAN